jgi:hypothetical protein
MPTADPSWLDRLVAHPGWTGAKPPHPRLTPPPPGSFWTPPGGRTEYRDHDTGTLWRWTGDRWRLAVEDAATGGVVADLLPPDAHVSRLDRGWVVWLPFKTQHRAPTLGEAAALALAAHLLGTCRKCGAIGCLIDHYADAYHARIAGDWSDDV